MTEPTLYERTLHLVRNAPRSLTYSAMGQEIGRTRAWVSAFALGKIPNASIAHVQALHDFLTSKQG